MNKQKDSTKANARAESAHELADYYNHGHTFSKAQSAHTTTLETVLAADPKNIAAKCCIERNKKLSGQAVCPSCPRAQDPKGRA